MQPTATNSEIEQPMYDSITDFYKAISAKGKIVMQEKRRNGERMHKPPIGYIITRDAEGRARLAADPNTFSLVCLAQTLIKLGYSTRRVSRTMYQLGLKTRNGNPLSPSSILSLTSDLVHQRPDLG